MAPPRVDDAVQAAPGASVAAVHVGLGVGPGQVSGAVAAAVAAAGEPLVMVHHQVVPVVDRDQVSVAARGVHAAAAVMAGAGRSAGTNNTGLFFKAHKFNFQKQV